MNNMEAKLVREELKDAQHQLWELDGKNNWDEGDTLAYERLTTLVDNLRAYQKKV